jgi:hypothetical protein
MTDDPGLDIELGHRLSDERPVPAAGFRGALGRRLAADDPGYGPRPAQLRTRVAACLAGGGVIAAIGALIALGAL